MEELFINILIYSGFFLMIVEIISGGGTGFDIFLVGIILIFSGLIGLITQNIIYSLISIILLSFFYILILRKIIHNKFFKETKKSNTDRLLNRKGIVVKKILPHKVGQVKIDEEIWRAVSEKKLDIGKEIIVKSIDGVTLIVQSL